MSHGCEYGLVSRDDLAQGYRRRRDEASRVVLVSSALDGLDALRMWAHSQRHLALIQWCQTSPWIDWDQSSVALWILDWSEAQTMAEGVGRVLSFAESTLLVLPRTATEELARILPWRNVDVLWNPYEPTELLWRVQRAIGQPGVTSSYGTETGVGWMVRGPIAFDAERLEVFVAGHPLVLRRAERDVLVYLMLNAGRFVSARELQTKVLGTSGSGSAARNQVYQVRSKLRARGFKDVIVHEPQKGYRLNWGA